MVSVFTSNDVVHSISSESKIHSTVTYRLNHMKLIEGDQSIPFIGFVSLDEFNLTPS